MSEVFLLVWWSTVWNHRKKETTNKSTWQTSELLRCAFRFSMSSATANKFEVHQTSTHHPSLWLLRDVCQFHFSAFSENECRVLENGGPQNHVRCVWLRCFLWFGMGWDVSSAWWGVILAVFGILTFLDKLVRWRGKNLERLGWCMMMSKKITGQHFVSHGLAETSRLKALRPSSDAYIYIFFVRTYNTWYIYIYIYFYYTWYMILTLLFVKPVWILNSSPL